MKNLLVLFMAGTLLLSVCCSENDSSRNPPVDPPEEPHPEARRDTIYPEVYETAFRNPMKGWRDCYAWGHDVVRPEWPEPYGSLIKEYMPWDSLEQIASDGVDRIVAYSNRRWAGYAEKNIKVIPRVYLDYPVYGPGGTDLFDPMDPDAPKPGSPIFFQHWPSDLDKWDYTSEAFRQRVKRLVEKIGQAWDGDPRVAYVEIGIIGQWGEHHTPDLSGTWASMGLPGDTYAGYPGVTENAANLVQRMPEREAWPGDFAKKTAYIDGMQRLLGEAFRDAFRQKKVLTRSAAEMQDYPFGFYWDAWGLDNNKENFQYDNLKRRDSWRTAPVGGEIAFPGFSSAGAMLDHTDASYSGGYRWRILRAVRALHCNHLGGITWDNFNREPFKSQAAELQKIMGYRFVITSFDYPVIVYPGEPFRVHFQVRNLGSSPFYYDWPVEISLIDPETREKVWAQSLSGVRISGWLPGDRLNGALEPVEMWSSSDPAKWEIDNYYYEEAPRNYDVSGELTLPAGLSSGKTYYIALAVLDPAGMAPSLRFAVRNYLEGGYHPMGYIGVGSDTEPAETVVPASVFDDLQSDRTLHYTAP